MDEFNASLVGLNPFVFYDFVDELVLAVPEAVHCFSLWRIVRASLWQLDNARCEKVPNAVVPGFSIHIEAIVRGNIERTKCVASLRRTLLKIFVKHLFPTRRVHTGGVGNHTVEIE
jgi:hypothetical protein